MSWFHNYVVGNEPILSSLPALLGVWAGRLQLRPELIPSPDEFEFCLALRSLTKGTFWFSQSSTRACA